MYVLITNTKLPNYCEQGWIYIYIDRYIFAHANSHNHSFFTNIMHSLFSCVDAFVLFFFVLFLFSCTFSFEDM